MKKLKLGVIFGGMSTEHEISIISGLSIIRKLDNKKYKIFPIYIDKKGTWYKYKEKTNSIDKIKVGYEPVRIKKIYNLIKYLKKLDCIFPVLHGLYGEDGTIQGLFELLKIPYVGCKVLSSSICMDKAYAKIIFNKANINQAKYMYIKKKSKRYIYVKDDFEENEVELEDICNIVKDNIKFPVYVKPSNSGSSLGINRAKNETELKKYIEYASNFDNKILIEEEIIGKEVECAVLGNDDIIASCIGEIKSAEDFYSFNSKYKNKKSYTQIPASILKEKAEEIKSIAIKAYKAADCRGLSRVDFFVQDETEKVYLNEINTLPGFTDISMYPKLFEASGIQYENLLNNLINLAINQQM